MTVKELIEILKNKHDGSRVAYKHQGDIIDIDGVSNSYIETDEEFYDDVVVFE